MRAIQTATLAPEDYSPSEMLQIYNGLDCCLTKEILSEIHPQLNPNAGVIYGFERAMQAPALEMTLRGLLVDRVQRGVLINDFEQKRRGVESRLSRLAHAVWGRDLNYNSPAQLIEFFYKVMALPEQHARTKGIARVSTNRESLEKLSAYLYARPFVNCILACRDYAKLLSVLYTGIDSDGRFRPGFHVAGTETGRWSSSDNAFGTGSNIQNITERLRRVFVADPGYKLAYIDLEQAESRAVGLLVYALGVEELEAGRITRAQFADYTAYIDACESGDLHTTVSKMVWPGMDWPGDPKGDRKIADQIFYRYFTFRDMAKRGGHGTNYYGKPRTMALHLKVETAVMADFQRAYFNAFPGIPKWHTNTARKLQLEHAITTPLARTRHFFGRASDDATLREAIAYGPQSTVGDLLNLGLWKLWSTMGTRVQVLAQIHDAVLIQYPEHLESTLLPEACACLETPITLAGRSMTIPTEAKTGWNWQSYDEKTNADGLKKYKGQDLRQRQFRTEVPLLDRRIY